MINFLPRTKTRLLTLQEAANGVQYPGTAYARTALAHFGALQFRQRAKWSITEKGKAILEEWESRTAEPEPK